MPRQSQVDRITASLQEHGQAVCGGLMLDVVMEAAQQAGIDPADLCVGVGVIYVPPRKRNRAKKGKGLSER